MKVNGNKARKEPGSSNIISSTNRAELIVKLTASSKQSKKCVCSKSTQGLPLNRVSCLEFHERNSCGYYNAFLPMDTEMISISVKMAETEYALAYCEA